MATFKQVMANRLNALKSRGPKTWGGKRRSSMNAVKHGLLALGNVLDGEDLAGFDGLRERLFEELAPEGEMEVLLVSRVVTLVWRLRRMTGIEQEMMEYERTARRKVVKRVESGEEKERTVTLGELFSLSCGDGDSYSKLRRYEGQVDRELYRALHELERRQMARKGQKGDAGSPPSQEAPRVVEVNVGGGATEDGEGKKEAA